MLYFMQCGTGYVKIGVSNDVYLRLSQLRAASPIPIMLVGMVNEGVEVEKQLKSQLAGSCANGEWFYPTMQVQEALLKFGVDLAITGDNSRVCWHRLPEGCEDEIIALSRQIGKIAERQGLTPEMVAKLSGISVGTVMSLLNSKGVVLRFDIILNISKVLGIEPQGMISAITEHLRNIYPDGGLVVTPENT